MPYVVGGLVGLAVSGWAAFTSLAWIDETTETGGSNLLTVVMVIFTVVLMVLGSVFLLKRGDS